MQEFQITLKNEKRKSYKTSLLIIIFLTLLSFLFLAYISKTIDYRNKSLLGAMYVAVGLGLHFLIKKKERVDFRWAAITLATFYYFKLDYNWLAITLVVISILYLIAVRDLFVYVSEKIISFPSLPKKKIEWKDLNNILLKDEILTIDFKNNFLVQQPIDETKSSVNEKEFNDFCKKQLSRSSDSRLLTPDS